MTMSEAVIRHKILMSVVGEESFEESGVPDTPENRAIWAKIQESVDAVPDGTVIDIPFDHNLLDDEGLWSDDDDPKADGSVET